MYDIVFLSYDEPNADANWDHLRARFPWALRVHGVKGILQAHQEAARRVRTDFFWVVDGDNRVEESFEFSHVWSASEAKSVPTAIWMARNSATGAVYGYGGVKLLNRSATLLAVPNGLDITHAISPNRHYLDEIASTTIIDATPFQAWRAGFREGVKLHLDTTVEGGLRAIRWNDSETSEFARMGFRAGKLYAMSTTDPDALARINDFDWVAQEYKEHGGT